MMCHKQITVIVICLLSSLSSNLLASSFNIFSNSNNNRLQQSSNTLITPTTTTTNTKNNGTFCTKFKTLELPDEPVTIKYRSTNTTLTIRMSTSYQGYLGFGLSTNGKMEGAEAIIGIPGDVSKYTLGSYFAKYVVSEERQQTLQNTSFVQNVNGSVLEFTKLLKENDSSGVGAGNDRYDIDGFGLNKFIWSVGIDNRLDFHVGFGSFPLELDPYDCEEEVVKIVVDRIESYELLFALHGIFAILAFGIFMPLAITASRARNLFDFEFRKKKAWYVLHTSLNSLAYGLTCVLVLLVIVAYSKKGKDHFVGSKHETVGLVTLLLMTVQVVAGVLRPDPYLPPPPSTSTSTSNSSMPSEKVVHNEPSLSSSSSTSPQLATTNDTNTGDASYSDSLSGEMTRIEEEIQMTKQKEIELIETDDVTSIGDTEEKASSTQQQQQQQQQQPKVRLVRTIWQRSHIVMGISTFGCGIFQMHSGVILYSTLFQSGSKTYIGLLWGLLGFVFVSITVTIVYSKRRKL